MNSDEYRKQCQIEKKISIICPYCGNWVNIPMCQAVNGETIACNNCHKDFVFREKDTPN